MTTPAPNPAPTETTRGDHLPQPLKVKKPAPKRKK